MAEFNFANDGKSGVDEVTWLPESVVTIIATYACSTLAMPGYSWFRSPQCTICRAVNLAWPEWKLEAKVVHFADTHWCVERDRDHERNCRHKPKCIWTPCCMWLRQNIQLAEAIEKAYPKPPMRDLSVTHVICRPYVKKPPDRSLL